MGIQEQIQREGFMCMCVYVPQLPYLFITDGQLGCFHVLVVVSSATVNIGVQVSLSILVSLVCMLSSGISGS